MNCFVYKVEYPYEYPGTSSKPIPLGFYCTAETDFRNIDSTTFDEIQRLTVFSITKFDKEWISETDSRIEDITMFDEIQ